MQKSTRQKLFELEIFEPSSSTGYGINAMLLNSTDLAEASIDEIKNELEALRADGLITYEDGFYHSTTSGQISARIYSANSGALQTPLINQKNHEPENLILAIAASHKVDFASGYDIIQKSSLNIYLHELDPKEIHAAIDRLINNELISNYEFHPKDSIHITGLGYHKYITEIQSHLGLSNEVGILSRNANEPIDDRFHRLGLDEILCENLASRWGEVNVCATSGAYLSAIILLGSILEGLLLAKLQEGIKNAMTASRAPKEGKTGSTKNLNDWSLQDYIAVAVELKFIPVSVEKHLHELRDSRNLVHPSKHIASKITADRSLYRISREVAETVIDSLVQK